MPGRRVALGFVHRELSKVWNVCPECRNHANLFRTDDGVTVDWRHDSGICFFRTIHEAFYQISQHAEKPRPR